MIEETLKQWRRSRFEYGRTDCLMSVGRYLAAQGGRDVPSQFEGTYHTREEASALMEAHGGPEAMMDMAGFPRIEPSTATEGDAVLIRLRDGDLIAGICTGPGIAVRSEKSVIELSRHLVKIEFAWRV